jgi:molybdopterin/thiamine biosynthesis adenylyltransferase
MNNIQVRIPAHVAPTLLAEIHRPSRREPVVFGLVSHATTAARHLILVRELVVPPESAFLPSTGHGARWSGAYTIGLLNRALEKQLGIFIFHAHGRSRSVQMSGDDLASANTLLPKFQLVAPERPHGSLVFGEGSVDGVILMPDRTAMNNHFTVRLLHRRHIDTWPLPPADLAEYQLLNHQPLTLTPLLRSILRRFIVAVVGVSGGGSQLAAHLAALGVGEIIAIDDQTTDESNRFATPQLGWLDALFRFRKTTSARIRCWFIDRRVTFTAVPFRVPEQKALDALKRADLIVGAVNNLHARADLMELAWRYCIPYVDIGLRILTKEGAPDPKPLVAFPGNLFTAVPGCACMWCTEFLTEKKLSAETGGLGRSYLKDSSDRAVLVSPFNGTMAAEAAAEVLRLVTGLDDRREQRHQYDGFLGTLLEMSSTSQPDCPRCASHLAAGDPIWRPIAQSA